MKPRLPINIGEIEKHYRIEEDGAVFSLSRNRYLKPTANTCGYYYVYLGKYMPHWFAVHRLVYFKYIGVCPDNLEVAHKDGVKGNCHWGNLEAITHGRNCLDSYRKHNRVHPPGNHNSPSWETKQLMALKKNKPIRDSLGVEYKSIEEATERNGTYRRAIYRSLINGKVINSLGKSFEYKKSP
jgi:hypothetical protein